MSAPVIVGTDGSPPATAAVLWAAGEAARRSLPLRIVHVKEPWSYGTPYYPAPGVLDQLAESGKQIVAEAAQAAREHRPDVEIETEIVYGPVAQSLREQSADGFETVVGHRGFGGFTGMLLGAVSLRVAGHAAGPVVVVRGDTDGDRGEVVAGIDPAEDPAPVLDHAFDAAGIRGARLRIVHTWQLLAPPVDFSGTADVEEIAQAVRTDVDKAVAPWRERHPEIEVVTVVGRDHPVRALTESSAQADLVIVGSRNRSALGLMHLGSVSHGLVHHAHCPVAVVRARS
ncbi:universal stress protein [Actinomadura scrupuli]|uniref:universal stress protein n=1 Tax=Actinomadura scrupuli TaxID=559629 RepID=UPI003D96EA65